jgi:hypothetical protein
MKFNWSYSWIILYIISIVLNIVIISISNNNNIIDDSMVKTNSSINYINGFISIIGFCIFIYWLVKFNNTKVLMYLWIIMLIISILLGLIAINGSLDNLTRDIGVITGQTTVIFLGALITFLIKKR